MNEIKYTATTLVTLSPSTKKDISPSEQMTHSPTNTETLITLTTNTSIPTSTFKEPTTIIDESNFNLFDFNSYGRTEWLILIASGLILICLIIGCSIIFCKIKKKRKRIRTLSTENVGIGVDSIHGIQSKNTVNGVLQQLSSRRHFHKTSLQIVAKYSNDGLDNFDDGEAESEPEDIKYPVIGVSYDKHIDL